ncbi:hypothetical protein ANTQUA_LOCUS9052 [Anthophora quadrimaculata]
MHSARMLSWKGEKHTQAGMQSSSAMTHSYTIQPTISADGQLLSPLFVVLKETSGQLGPRVQSRMFTAPNVVIGASTSGKLNKEFLRQWLESVFFPHSPENSILLLDSWTGYDGSLIRNVTPPNKTLTVLSIPKNTTGLIQPLNQTPRQLTS